MVLMKRWIAPWLAVWLAACDAGDGAPPTSPPSGSLEIIVEDATFFLPKAWSEQPAREENLANGVQLSTGGWGQSSPRLGPHSSADGKQPYTYDLSDETYRKSFDPFLRWSFRFEIPRLDRAVEMQKRRYHNLDVLTMAYRSPNERIKQPYEELLSGLVPEHGTDLGGGWREVERELDGRRLRLRFDAEDWRKSGGSRPMRLAAAYDGTIWDHYQVLSQPGWSASFRTIKYPVSEWTHRYDQIETLFGWMQAKPEDRQQDLRFEWWTDAAYRPPT